MRTQEFEPIEIIVNGMCGFARELGIPEPIFNVCRVTDDDPHIGFREPHPAIWALDHAMRGYRKRQLVPTLVDLEGYARAWETDVRVILAEALGHPRSPFGIEARGDGLCVLRHRGVKTQKSLRGDR